MSSHRRLEKVATVLGTVALLGLTVLLLLLAVGLLLDAWTYYQRRADAQFMWLAFSLEAATFLTYATVVGLLTVAVVRLPSRRPILLLIAGALTSIFGVWAVALNSENLGLRIAATSSVLAGLCALAGAIALLGLRMSEKPA